MFSMWSCKFSRTERMGSTEEITRIVYRYGDSSVPPTYHRSYQIDIDRSSAKVVVESYGTILTDTVFLIREEDFKSLCKIFATYQFRQIPERKSRGCTGGHSEYLTVYRGSEVLLDGYVYYCSGEKYGTLEGDLESFGIEVKKLIPDFQRLLKRDMMQE